MNQVIKQKSARKKEKENGCTLSKFQMNSGMFSMERFYQTEQQQQFGQDQKKKEIEVMLRSSPKNKQLLQLKQNYRRLAQQL